MAKPAQVLQIHPPHEIVFKGPFTDVITTHLELTNPSEKAVCFKVKTTAPKQYCVRPNSGLIPPKEKVKVAVMLQPFDYNAEEKSKHKFMVQTAFVPDEETSTETIWKTVTPSELMDSKLRVMFEMPNIQVQGTGDETFSTTVATPPKQSSSPSLEAELRKLADEKKRLLSDNQTLERENVGLRERLERADRQSSTEVIATPSSVNMLQVCVVAILALLMGLLVGKIF